MTKIYVDLTIAERREFTELRNVTLNGKRATISGYYNDFARVADRITGLSCEWSWETVAHIVRNCDGRFKS